MITKKVQLTNRRGMLTVHCVTAATAARAGADVVISRSTSVNRLLLRGARELT